VYRQQEQRGRPRSFQDDEVAPVIRQDVKKGTGQHLPITSKMSADEVTAQTDIYITRRSMSRLLRRLEYRPFWAKSAITWLRRWGTWRPESRNFSKSCSTGTATTTRSYPKSIWMSHT